MEQHFKKIFSVFIAILIGGGIVFFAWRATGAPQTKGSALNTGNWKNSLSVVPQSPQAKTSNLIKNTIESSTTEATTTTDIISRKLLLEYVYSQKGAATTTLDDVAVKNIAARLAGEVVVPKRKQYTLSDLNINTENTPASYALYSNTTNTLIKEHLATEKTENELVLVDRAIKNNDGASLEMLTQKSARYENLLKKLLSLETPSSLAPIHLHLIQSYETLRSATLGLQKILIDPVMGIVAIEEYRSGIDALFITSQEFADFFATQ